MNVVTTRNAKQVGNFGEKGKEVEESYGKKNVEFKENEPTPPEKEAIEEFGKETSYVSPIPYKPLIPFS